MSNDITELFQRNPMDLTDDNIDQIIKHMREKRHLFKASQSRPSAAKPKKLTAAQEKLSKLNLGDFKL